MSTLPDDPRRGWGLSMFETDPARIAYAMPLGQLETLRRLEAGEALRLGEQPTPWPRCVRLAEDNSLAITEIGTKVLQCARALGRKFGGRDGKANG